MADSPFRWPGGARCAVSLTFDDARPSQLDVGLPILDRHGVRGTFYASLGPLRARADDWRRAASRGHEIGNHTCTHPCSGNFHWARGNALEEYTLARMEEELAGASAAIEAAVGVVPRTFAYPCGQTFVGRGEGYASYVPLVGHRFLAGRGFLWETHNDPARCELAHLAAYGSDGWTFERFRDRIAFACEHGGWAVFCGHETGPGGHQTTLAAELDRLCAWLGGPDTPAWTATVAEVAARVLRSRTAGVQ